MLNFQLNQVYQPLEQKQFQLQAALSELPYRIRTGWFNGHYHRNVQGQWERSAFPIPEVDVLDLCDVEIHHDHICVTAKLRRKNALAFCDKGLWEYPVEVYGVEDYLQDFFREGLSPEDMRHNILQSKEEEIGFSFMLPFDTSPEKVLALVTMLQQEGFYY